MSFLEKLEAKQKQKQNSNNKSVLDRNVSEREEKNFA